MKTGVFLFYLSLCIHALQAARISKKAIIGYFPNWLNGTFPVSKVDFTKYAHIHYAFALMVDGHLPTWENASHVEKELPQLVSAAHKGGAKVLTSLGGWSGSITFSKMANNTKTRKDFVNWCINHMKKYKTDGIDIDWEYPGRQGAGCNTVDEDNDVDNFLKLLKELRQGVDKQFKSNKKEITIAASVSLLKSNVSDFAHVLDRVNVMTYDINGAWNEQTGPNSPLYAPKGSISFSSAIEGWIKAGIPTNKIAGGIAFYGRSTTAKENMLKTKSIYQDQVKSVVPKGDSKDTTQSDPYCPADNGAYSGTWRFNHLLSEGVLSTPLKAKLPWVRTWDNSTATPWLFNPKTNTFLTYDDPESIAKKACYSLKKDLAGVMIWSVDQDTDKLDLLNAAYKIRNGKC
ncbi:hypothetical protein G6F33_001745 [Rhizopus arrhizus]|nr:hypothetical protein G6F33_001745 [Rhizopus arrhizus]